MIFRPAQRLHALAIAGCRLIDVSGYRSGADKADRPDVRVFQQSIHRNLIALHQAQHAIGNAGLLGQFRKQHTRGWNLLRRLEDERIATADGIGKHP